MQPEEKPIKQKTFSSKTEEMRKLFVGEKNKWTEIITNLTSMLKHFEKFGELQIEVHNKIMDGLNDKNSLSNHLIILNKILREKKYQKFVEIKTEIDLKIKTKEDQTFVLENSIKDLLERAEVLMLQIDYMDNVIKNLKDILWSIKNFIEIKRIFE